MENVPEEELVGIWFRWRKRLPLELITETDPEQLEAQLDSLFLSADESPQSERHYQQTGAYMVERGISKRLINVDETYLDIVSGGTVIPVETPSGQRFQMTKGTRFAEGMVEGRKEMVRGGIFVKGQTREEALQAMRERFERVSQNPLTPIRNIAGRIIKNVQTTLKGLLGI